MKRYQIVPQNNPNIFAPVFQSDDGEWVKYEDIKNLLYYAKEVCSWDWGCISKERHIDITYAMDDMDKLEQEVVKLTKGIL